MRKRIFIIPAVLMLFIAAGIIYLNRVFLPQKIKSIVIKSIEGQTRRKVTLASLRFNLFKGLVLTGLEIIDGDRKVLTVEEADCSFLLWPFFKKQLIIPSIIIRSPRLYLERKEDASFNISDLLVPHRFSVPAGKAKINTFINKVRVYSGRIEFVDAGKKPVFSKVIENIDFAASFTFPANVRFKLDGKTQSSPPSQLSAAGEYSIIDKKLFCKVTAKGLSPGEFSLYYSVPGLSVSKGTIDLESSIEANNLLVDCTYNILVNALDLSKDNLVFNLSCSLNGQARYNPADKKLIFSGNADISSLDISGLKQIQAIKGIKGKVSFDDSGLSSDKITAFVLGLPVEAKIKVSDLSDPVITGDLTAACELEKVPGLLKEGLSLAVPPVKAKGKARLGMGFYSKAATQSVEIKGGVEILDGSIKFDSPKAFFEGLQGRIDFTLQNLEWSDFSFNYLGNTYKTSGTVENLKQPDVSLTVNSKDLALETDFNIKGKLIDIVGLSAKLFNSSLFCTGSLQIDDTSKLPANFNTNIKFNLEDLKKFEFSGKDDLEKAKLSGAITIKNSLKGDLFDMNSLIVKASLDSSLVSAYGLKATGLLMEVSIVDSEADIGYFGASFYGGKIDAQARIKLSDPLKPFSGKGNLVNVKLAELKMDTPVKKEDISGTLNINASLSGSLTDAATLNGKAAAVISEGKFWQLDLFKGIGRLLFASDFTNIIFTDGCADFLIKEKNISTDNLRLNSELADITGSMTVGFDGALDAAFNVHVSDQAPLTGSLKDITTAIVGQANKFGVIRISGTLKEPKYKFQPAVGDIIDSIKCIFWKKAD